jgi:DNA-binding CsgD family transcriptional regulator
MPRATDILTHRPRRLSHLVGRSRELAILRDELTGMLAGAGRLVLIAGEAGIGKTTLAEALGHDAAARGALVLTGQCYDLAQTPPYGPWLELAARYPGPSDDPPPLASALCRRGGVADSTSQEALFAEIQATLVAVAARRPLALILEDLHWSDPASLDLLRRLGREVDRLPLLLVATYRHEEVGRQHPLYTLLPVLVREARATRLELRPLEAPDLRALVRARYALPANDLNRLVAYLQSRAEGNPFFIGELLRALEDERVLRRSGSRADQPRKDERWELGDVAALGLPVLLRQVLERRLARLEEDERGLLAVAATIGPEVSLALWAAVSLIEEDALLDIVERGVGARVLEASADGLTVRFAHALVREALHEGLLPPRRRIWHRRVAEALLAQAEPDPDAVAYHFRQAGDDRAGEWLVRAGDRAQQAYAWHMAAERYEAALALRAGDDADALERARLLVVLAQVRRHVAPKQGVTHLETAERLASAAGDRALAASALFDRGHLRSLAGDHGRGLIELQAGLELLEALPPAVRARLPTLTILEVPPAERRRYHREVVLFVLAVLGRLTEARSVGGSDDDRSESSTFRGLLGWSFIHAALGQPDRARRALAQARAACGDQRWEVATTCFWELELIVLPYESDQVLERRRLADDAEREWARAGGVLADVSPKLARLPLLVLEGRWDEARDLALATLTATRISDWRRRYAAHILGQLAHAQGDTDLAWRLVREELPAGPTTAPGAAWFLPALALQRLAATLALDGNDLATARAWLTAHDHWLAWSGAALGRAEGQLGWAAYHRAAGNLAQARLHAAQALEHAGAPRQPLALLTAHRLLGEIATKARDFATATSRLDAALRLADACAVPYERALTLLAQAELRRATREREAIEALRIEARAICERLGARRALARADALAPRRVSAPGGHPVGLTVREAEVLASIADGASNQEIAVSLYLSVRTVERHINSLYRKIGARGRADATAYAARHGLLRA